MVDKKEEKKHKSLNIIWMLEKWSKNLRDNFDDLEESVDLLYPHLKKIKNVILKEIEDGNWKNVEDFCDHLEEEEIKAKGGYWDNSKYSL
tara:strand:- start:960 stop:1229 length:270 start_codon:yes stop_codon:yes gene_type:complete